MNPPCFCNCSMFCYALLCVHPSFAIISMGKRELAALLCLSSWCLVIDVWLFLTIPWVYLQFVIEVFPDHTHLAMCQWSWFMESILVNIRVSLLRETFATGNTNMWLCTMLCILE